VRTQPLFDVRGVRFSYPEADAPALVATSLQIPRGDYLALLGPNGAGKSTLLRLLAGLRRPQHGDVLLDGIPVSGYPRRTLARRVAMLPQRLDVAFDAEVESLVGLGRTPHRRGLGSWWGQGASDRAAVDAALDATGTARFRHRPFHELSGGEQQRVALALALAQEADVLLLDEPTSHLDPYQAQAVLDLVASVRRERGLTVVAVFHDLNLAALYSARLLVLSAGAVLAAGGPREVLRADVLDRAYGPCLRFVSHPDHDLPQVLPIGRVGNHGGLAPVPPAATTAPPLPGAAPHRTTVPQERSAGGPPPPGQRAAVPPAGVLGAAPPRSLSIVFPAPTGSGAES
jgi:iron complex transport system ATP-binding protein